MKQNKQKGIDPIMKLEILENFRKKIAEGPVFGPFCKTGDPAFIECAGYAGFDFAILDTEHGPVSYESMQNNIRAAEVSGILPVIRTQDFSESSIGKALDIGALGVEIPQITSAEDAKTAIRHAKFFPEGERGVCRFVRAAHYSATERSEYFKRANQALVILQLEGRKAIENLDEILAVKGIDIIFIGPYDLSQSLGVPGQVTHPTVIARMKEIVDRCASLGITVGTFVDTPETAKMWRDAGVRYLSYSVDVGIFYEACRAIVENARK